MLRIFFKSSTPLFFTAILKWGIFPSCPLPPSYPVPARSPVGICSLRSLWPLQSQTSFRFTPDGGRGQLFLNKEKIAPFRYRSITQFFQIINHAFFYRFSNMGHFSLFAAAPRIPPPLPPKSTVGQIHSSYEK
jgi:hypothetical protein